MAKLPTPRLRKYSERDVERGLLELALCGGRYAQALKRLTADGYEHITRGALENWARDLFAHRYAELAATHAQTLAMTIAAEAEAFIMRAAEVEYALLERIEAAIEADAIPARDLSRTLRDVSVTKAIAMDKIASPIRGRPTVIHGDVSFDELLARLKRLGLVSGLQ